MGYPPVTPEQALDWVRKMMVIFTPETMREFQQMVKDHEQVIMGGWDRRQRKFYPGMLVSMADVASQLRQLKYVVMALSVIVVLGGTAPSWWPLLKGVFFP